MPDDRRRRLIRQYARFLKQLRTVRRAMADYFAGQQFFDFYPGEPEEDEEVRQSRRGPKPSADAAGPTPLDRTPRLRDSESLLSTTVSLRLGTIGASDTSEDRRRHARKLPDGSSRARSCPTRSAASAPSAAGSCPRPDGRPQPAGRGIRARPRPIPRSRRGSTDYLTRLRRPPLAALPRRAADRDGRRGGDLPEARGPEPHRRPQDQQRARPGPARPADGQDPGDRRDRRGPARRRHGDGLRPLRPRMHGLHGRGGHPPPEAQRLQHEDPGRRRSCPSTTGSRTLRDATNEAMRDWMGSSQADALHDRQRRRPAPVPDDRPRLPGGDRPRDPASSAWSRLGRLPDAVVACVGGGSNAAGMFYPFIEDADGRADRRRGRRPRARRPASTPRASRRAGPASSTAASATSSRTTTARPRTSTRSPPASTIPASAPSTATGRTRGRVRYESITDAEALEAYDTTRPARRHPPRPRVEPRPGPGLQGSPPARARARSSSSASPAAATRTPTRSPGSAASRCDRLDVAPVRVTRTVAACASLPASPTVAIALLAREPTG